MPVEQAAAKLYQIISVVKFVTESSPWPQQKKPFFEVTFQKLRILLVAMGAFPSFPLIFPREFCTNLHSSPLAEKPQRWRMNRACKGLANCKDASVEALDVGWHKWPTFQGHTKVQSSYRVPNTYIGCLLQMWTSHPAKPRCLGRQSCRHRTQYLPGNSSHMWIWNWKP